MEKIKQIIEKVNYYYKVLWDDPRGKAGIGKTLGQIWYLLKKIKPSKLEGDVLFGTGDPASTGQAIGAIAAVYGFLPEKLKITPDFENQVYEGRLHAKGKLRLIHVVIIAVRLIADKNFRYVVNKFLAKEDANNEQQ